jgi:hypothetical protein
MANRRRCPFFCQIAKRAVLHGASARYAFYPGQRLVITETLDAVTPALLAARRGPIAPEAPLSTIPALTRHAAAVGLAQWDCGCVVGQMSEDRGLEARVFRVLRCRPDLGTKIW